MNTSKHPTTVLKVYQSADEPTIRAALDSMQPKILDGNPSVAITATSDTRQEPESRV